jgi:hypothetical protein
MVRRRWREAVVLAVLAAAVLPCGGARAEGLSAALEPGYTRTDIDTTDQAGHTTHEHVDLLTQSYRLAFDRSLTERLNASAGGTWLDQRGWRSDDGVSSFERSRATTLFGRLTLGTPTLAMGAGADRRQQSVLSPSSPTFITDSYTGYATWRPADLPDLDLRLSRTNTHDAARRAQDTTTDTAILSSRFHAGGNDLRYALSWNHTADELNRTDTTSIDQIVNGTRSDILFDGRTTTYVSGTFTSRNTSTSTSGNGNVARQQIPVAGLSAVEAFPATPVNVTLAPNPLLIDGNTTTSASVNVGFGPGTLGDRNARDVGGRFADIITSVNTIYVWFDRPISAVGIPLSSSAAVYQSDDNLTWTPVQIAQAPVVSPIENRIELTITQTQARYLKVVLQPLAPGITTDAAYRDVFVTEIQFLLVLPAALVPRNTSSYGVSANGSARTVFVRSINLAHDLQASVAHQTEGGGSTTYTLVNGLSASRAISPTLMVSARGARQDDDAGRGHEGLWQWNAALTGKPYLTAFWTLNYSGSANDNDESLNNSVTALGRADLYEGVSTQASGTASFASQGEKTVNGIVTQVARKSSAGQANASASFTPNSLVSLTLGVLYSRSVSFTVETGDVVTTFARGDATLAFTPAPALSASGTVSRVFISTRPTTLATMQLNYFPLRGDLQLSFAYSKSLDTATASTTELYGPSLRWNVRPGVALTSTYQVQENVSPAQTQDLRTLTTNLLLTL